MRQVVNGLFYVNKTGCPSEMLAKAYPNHNSVDYHCARWSREGAWETLKAPLREQARQEAGRAAPPRGASIDSQSVKTTVVGGEARGFDGGKLVKGRQRHSRVDTLGNLLKVLVTAAHGAAAKAARQWLEHLPKALLRRLKRLWADAGYPGEFAEWVAYKFKKSCWILPCQTLTRKAFKSLPGAGSWNGLLLGLVLIAV